MGVLIQKELDPKHMNYIQRLYFERNARKDCIQSFLELHQVEENAFKMGSPIFQRYHQEYVEFFTEYELAKQALEQEYLPEGLEGHSYEWSLDFRNQQITFEVLCDCGVRELEAKRK